MYFWRNFPHFMSIKLRIFGVVFRECRKEEAATDIRQIGIIISVANLAQADGVLFSNRDYLPLVF